MQTRRMELTSKVEKMKTLETNIAEAKKRIEEIAVDQKVRPFLLLTSLSNPLSRILTCVFVRPKALLTRLMRNGTPFVLS